MVDWQEIRSRYPLVNSCIYLDSARTGAISVGTANNWKTFIDDQLQSGLIHRDQWIDSIETTRKLAAGILEAQPDDISLITDVFAGVSFLAGSINQNNKIVLIENDFPSLTHPWVQQGFDITWIPREKDLTIDLNKIEEALKMDGKILAVSWMQYNSGFSIDLDKLSQLCKKYEARLIVDGTQGFCALPLNLKALEVGAFLASGFKWMTAGFGTGISYINPEFRNLLGFGNKNASDMLEQSHPKFQNILGLENALTELNEIGLVNIQERTAYLSDYLQQELVKARVETLSNFPNENSSALKVIKGNNALFEKLIKDNIRVTFRDDYLRIAPYFYNYEGDIDRLIQFVRR